MSTVGRLKVCSMVSSLRNPAVRPLPILVAERKMRERQASHRLSELPPRGDHITSAHVSLATWELHYHRRPKPEPRSKTDVFPETKHPWKSHRLHPTARFNLRQRAKPHICSLQTGRSQREWTMGVNCLTAQSGKNSQITIRLLQNRFSTYSLSFSFKFSVHSWALSSSSSPLYSLFAFPSF